MPLLNTMEFKDEKTPDCILTGRRELIGNDVLQRGQDHRYTWCYFKTEITRNSTQISVHKELLIGV